MKGVVMSRIPIPALEEFDVEAWVSKPTIKVAFIDPELRSLAKGMVEAATEACEATKGILLAPKKGLELYGADPNSAKLMLGQIFYLLGTLKAGEWCIAFHEVDKVVRLLYGVKSTNEFVRITSRPLNSLSVETYIKDTIVFLRAN